MERFKPPGDFLHRGVPLPEILLAHETWIKQRKGQKADLISADLVEAGLARSYLIRADLIKANLKGADLKEANLREANLFGANLTGARMIGANLERANLEKVNLSEANLCGADLTEANLKGAYLSWTKMIRSILSEADLKEAYLRGADLTLSDLSKADLSGANLIGANLSDARMGGVNLRGANLTEAYLRETDLSYARLNQADLREGNLEKVNLNSADLTNANLSNASLVGADLTAADLSGACLDHANTSGWIIRGIQCTHIVRGKKREVVRFGPGEFERKYVQIQKSFEIILNAPLNASAYHMGKFITRSINHLVGSRVIDLKALEVLTPSDTRFVFHIFDDAFHEQRKEAVEIELRVALNKYFREQSAEREQSYFGDIEEEDKGPIAKGDLVSPAAPPWNIDFSVMEDQLVEHYNRLGNTGRSIYRIITAIFQDGPPPSPLNGRG